MNKPKHAVAATGGALGGGAIVTTLGLVSLCASTKVLHFLGFSGGTLSWLGVLEPYQPLLLVPGGAAFGMGLWRIVRRRRMAKLSRA